MLSALRCGLILGLLGLASTGLLNADERDEFPNPVEKPIPPQSPVSDVPAEIAAQLKSAGIQRREVTDQEIGLLKERLQDLVREEQKLNEVNAPSEARERVHNQIQEVKVALAHRSRPDFDPKQQFEAAARRIEHLRLAAKYLKQAEAHDLAHAVMQKAEAQERELAEAKMRLAGEHAQTHHSAAVLEAQELRREVEQLRAEIRELRQLIEKRSSEPTDR